jgi:Pyridoxamine 5'-phosphate oxidase
MARWQDVVDSEPDLAAEVQRVFDAHKHKTIATLRRDGSPRLSGLELGFTAGDVAFGMMPRSRKAADLRRDPRTEVHSASFIVEGEEESWHGDARISGRAREITDLEERARYTDTRPEAHPLFALDIERVVRVKLEGSPLHLVVSTWRPGRPLERAVVD